MFRDGLNQGSWCEWRLHWGLFERPTRRDSVFECRPYRWRVAHVYRRRKHLERPIYRPTGKHSNPQAVPRIRRRSENSRAANQDSAYSHDLS
jgi:hypothetical protein